MTDLDYYYNTISLNSTTSTTHSYNPPNHFIGLSWDSYLKLVPPDKT